MCKLGVCSKGGFLIQDGGRRDKGGIHWPRNGKHFRLKTEKLQPAKSNAKRPWVSMHHFGEVTSLAMQRRPPEPNEALFMW